MHYQRGQALLEFSISSSLFVMVLAGIVYAAQTGILGERTAISARMAGRLSTGSSPYSDTSFDATYDAIAPGYENIANQYGVNIAIGAPTAPPGVNSQQCQTPTESANLINSIPSIWASYTKPTFQCSQILQPMGTSVGTQAPQLFRQFTYQVSTTTGSHGMFPVAGITATSTYYAPPTVAMIMQCQPNLGGTVSGSLFPGSTTGSSASTPLSLGDLDSAAAALGVSALACGPIGDAGVPSDTPPTAPAQTTSGGCTAYVGALCQEADAWGDPHYDMDVNGQSVISNYTTSAPADDLIDAAGTFANAFQISTATAQYKVADALNNPFGIVGVTTQVGGSVVAAQLNADGSPYFTIDGQTIKPGVTYTTADGTGNIQIIPSSSEPQLRTVPVAYLNTSVLQIEENNDATGAQVTQYIDAYTVGDLTGLDTAVVGYNVNLHGLMPTLAGVASPITASVASDVTAEVAGGPKAVVTKSKTTAVQEKAAAQQAAALQAELDVLNGTATTLTSAP